MIFYLLLTPLMVMWLARRWKWIDTISPMTVLYVIGLLVANFLPLSPKALQTNTLIQNLAIPLAIPLMLMGCTLNRWSTKLAAKTFSSGLLAVLIATIAGFFIFKGKSEGQDFAQVCAVATGIYTGGIPNIGAIAKGVGMSDELFLYVSSYDLIVTGCYLIFVIFLGKKVFRRLLPNRSTPIENPIPQDSNDPAPQNSKLSLLWVILLTLLIAGISYIAATTFSKDHSVNMTILVLCLTTLSIAASFIGPIKKQQQSFSIGLYCVYVFCLGIATACNVREMDLLGSLNILAYITFVIFGSLILQILFARLFKIDGDSVLVCSVALINSPPFVPLVAALLNNKDIVILGISIGLLGYMLGNYLGIGLYHLLALFC